MARTKHSLLKLSKDESTRLVPDYQGPPLSGTLPRGLSGTSPRHLIGTSWQHLKSTQQRRAIRTSPQRFKQVSDETPNNVAAARLHHLSELSCSDAFLVGLYYVFKLLSH